MKKLVVKFQIGKNGLTEEFLESITLAFKGRKQIRIHVLKSCTREKEKLKQIAEEIKTKLPLEIRYRILGFTIILLKQ